MCGIIGLCVNEKFKGRVRETLGGILTKGLKSLEYRGYDSVGIAVSDGSYLVIRKAKGKVDEISRKLSFVKYDGLLGLGHTRWATHGEPCDRNAHPVYDCTGNVVAVHNGIIRNFMRLRKELGSSHVFNSDTDTEVVAHMVEEGVMRGEDPYESFKRAVSRLEGSYALAVMVLGVRKIFFAKRESPLVVGLGDGAMFLSSDITALLPYTDRVIPLEDGEIGWIDSDTVYIERIDSGDTVDVASRTMRVEWKAEMAAKGGYPHYMLKEIHEQPLAVKSTIDGVLSDDTVDRVARALAESEAIFIAAAGTSYHAGLVIKHFIEKLSGRPLVPFIASEYKHYSRLATEGSVLLAISQSGETIDTLKTVRFFKDRGAKTIALTNVIGSAIYREADEFILTRAGPEIGVAATKTFLTQVAAGEILAVKTAFYSGKMTEGEMRRAINELESAPKVISKSISISEPKASLLSEDLSKSRSLYVLGRGLGVPLAMEGSLKIKEISYLHAESYPAGESKHGPIALVEEGFPVIFVITEDSKEDILSNVMEMNARRAYTIAIASGQSEASELSRERIIIDVGSELLEPLALAPPLQLMAYYMSIRLGHDPDKPRNLAKTVTVE